MPSFDVVSEVDKHELTNAIDQANRELSTRFDFKGVDARFEQDGEALIKLSAPSDFQLKQMADILRQRLSARSIDARCMEFGEIESNLAGARQQVTVKQGIEQKLAKQIAAKIKESKIKVDTQINGDKLRVNGKKRDDLQEVIALLKKSEFEQPLQFDNFRD
ncbi:YajQ family cyclic di-GMP-binding protein [Stenotrophomonas mori]|uniref:Nucleotide-binding protein K5L01_11610 n=1 Tax=Stenotrophomonas mori TaxID=2871096 RepID=A0ABT0SIY2_9GAMM|nr:YajQ family cyclic di-GMP-binding protein [Stenotrophomonas mori]MCL7715289.1 YajQ family cyclic di-GMP-binding protein [Stenotrophomonas mori]